MPIELTNVINQSMPIRGTQDAKKPLHLGNDGQIEVRERRGTPPGRWTRFKAALINVPLIGKLQTIQVAGEEVRIARLQARFRDEFHHVLADRYGRDVADRAFTGKSAGSMQKPLTARRIEKIMGKAESQARLCGARNGVEIARHLPYPGQKLAVVFADMCAMANPEYLQRQLQESEIRAAYDTTATVLDELQRHGLSLEAVEPELKAFDKELSSKPIDEYPAIAARYLTRIIGRCHEACNRATIERSFPEELASSSSSPRGPSIKPDDLPLVALLCAGALGPDTPLLSEKTAAQAWRDLNDVRGALRRELPQTPAERIDAALIEVSKGRTALTAETLRALAPKAFIEGEMKRQLDPNDPESVFWNAALEASGAYQAGKRESGTPFDDNPNVTVLLTALAKGMTYGLNDAVEALRRQSGGEVPLSTLLSTLREQLIANIKQATHEHLEAMDQIRQSRTLNPRQKEILRLYAEPPVDGSQRPRRLDFVQLRLYEAIANTIASRLPRLHEAAERGDPATLYDCVSDIRDAFLPGFMEIVKHAGEMRASGDLTDETDQGRLFELCLNLALAKHHAPPPLQAAGSRPGTPSASPQVPRKVSAMQAANRSGAPSTPGKRPAGSRASEIETGAASTSTRPAALPDPLAAEAPPEDDGRGEFVDAPRQFSIACELSPLNGVVRAGTLYEALMGISSGIRVASVRDGDWEPLYRMRPELLVRTLADPKCCAAELEADEPGVFADPSFGNPIAPDYNPAAVFDPARHSVSLGQLELPPAHVPDTLRQVLGRADIILNGRRLTPDPADRENPAKRAIEAFGGTFAPDGDEVGAAVAAVAASDALQNFATDIEQAAFAPPASLEPQREVHEIWQDRDGSWLVRSTRVSHPTAQGGRPLDTDGVVLCTMTHRIAPPGEPGAQPGGAAARVELVDQPRAVIMLSEPKRAPAD